MRVDAAGPAVEDLATLVLLVDLGDLTRVAERLGVDTATVSRRLKPFHERYGVLERSGGRLVLTARGRAGLPAVRWLVRQHEDLSGWLTDKKSAPVGLVVATGAWGAVHYLPPALTRFRQTHPAALVRSVVCRGRDRISGVAAGAFDLAIVSHSAAQVKAVAADVECAVALLDEQPLVLLAGAGTDAGRRLAGWPDGQDVPLGEVAALELIGPDERSGLRRQVQEAAGQRLRFAHVVGGWLAAAALAREGLGTALVPEAVAKGAGPGLLFRRLKVHLREWVVSLAADQREEATALRVALLATRSPG
jgi:DNA-binding transcriptional LysR family regulator